MLERPELERFVDRYAGHAYRFAYGLAGNEPDARELVQEAFVRVFKWSERLDAQRPLENWFLTMMKNLYYDGRRRCRSRALSLDAPIGEGMTVADTVPDGREEALLSRLEREESVRFMREALESLDQRSRALLMMIDVQDLSYECAAQVMDCPVGTVRSALSRARSLLRRKLLDLEAAS